MSKAALYWFDHNWDEPKVAFLCLGDCMVAADTMNAEATVNDSYLQHILEEVYNIVVRHYSDQRTQPLVPEAPFFVQLLREINTICDHLFKIGRQG